MTGRPTRGANRRDEAPVIFNPPGRAELDYRIGSYRSLLREMIARMRSSKGRRAGTVPELPLPPIPEGLAHSDSDNWVLSLMKSWATVGDVLAFYQERIANEGFLRTAVEERSLHELARMVDYIPNPAIAAQGLAAFQVARSKGLVERIVVPAGTKILSLPIRSQVPEHFETLADIEARREWNAMRPRLPKKTVQPELSHEDTGLELRGARTGLKVGDAVVISGRWLQEDPDPSAIERYFRPLSAVVPIRTEVVPATRGNLDSGKSGPSGHAVGAAPATSATPSGRRLPASKQRTRIEWLRPLRPPRAQRRFSDLEIMSLRRRAQLFGHNAPKWKDLPAKTKRLYQPILGGVQVSDDAGDSWTSSNVNLPQKPLRAIVSGSDGSLFVAVSGMGIYRLKPQGSGWEPVNQGLSKKDVHALAVEASGFLLAGATDGAVFRSVDLGESWQSISGSILKKSGNRWKPIDTRLPRVTVRSLEKVDSEWGSFLIAGTDQGVYRSSDESSGWEPANLGLPETSAESGASKLVVHAVVSGDRPGMLWIGSKSGVFVSYDLGGAWAPANQGLPETDDKGLSKTEVLALETYSDERAGRFYLVAATSRGVYRSLDLGTTWRAANHGLPQTDPATGASKTKVRALASSWDPQVLTSDLFAATAAGLFRSNDQGETWERIADDVVGDDVTALGTLGTDKLVAAGPLGGFSADHWPGFRLRAGRVDLSGVQPKILPGGWIAIIQEREGEEPLEGIYRVESVDTLIREDFTLKETVTRLQVDAGDELGLFDLRLAKVYLNGEAREVYLEEKIVREPLPRSEIILADLLDPAPEPGRKLIVSGKRMRVRILDKAQLTADGQEAHETTAEVGQEFILMSSAPGDSTTRMKVKQPGGVSGWIKVEPGGFTLLGARDDDPEVAEPCRVAGSSVDDVGSRAASRLVLESSLVNAFDPETVRIYGNVATAAAGEDVPEDVLGSGNSAKAHQSFVLKKPLTYDVGSHGSAATSTLKVSVDGVEWNEVESLLDCGPRDEVFMVRRDPRGLPHILFGDGVHGARLPTGHENVVATYRSGNSVAGVEAGHLKMLRTRPVGLQAVTNPLPIDPGVPAEGPEGIRTRLPLSIRAMGRAVSADDYEDLVLAYPGVARACVARFWTGSGHLLHITFGSEVTRKGSDQSALCKELLRYLSRNRLEGAPLEVAPAAVRTFRFSARLLIDRRHQAEIVEERIRSRLAESFSAVARDFGEPVLQADLVATVQSIEGVEVVEPTRFHWSDCDSELVNELRPKPATLRHGRVLAAQLAALDLETLMLEIEVAS